MSKAISRNSSSMGQTAVLFSAILWSTGGLFIKLIDWDPVIIAGVRSLIAGLFMLAVRLLSPGKRRAPFKLRYLWGGGLAYSITMLLFVPANKLTTSANAILLQDTAPVQRAGLGSAFGLGFGKGKTKTDKLGQPCNGNRGALPFF